MSTFLRQAQDKLFSVNKGHACRQAGYAGIYILVGVLLLAVLGGAYYFAAGKNIVPLPFKKAPVACTQEAKQCPDGSYVGREGPNCEFKPCPTSPPLPSPDEITNWKTYTDKDSRFSFMIPPDWSVKTSTYEKNLHLENQYGYVAGFDWVDKKNELITYCEEYPDEPQSGFPRTKCESFLINNALVIINWGKWTSPISKEQAAADVMQDNKIVEFYFSDYSDETQNTLRKILSTFKFLDQKQTNIELPPLYPRIKWTETNQSGWPFRTNNDTFIEKDASVVQSVEIYKSFPPAELVDGFRDYYTNWFENRGWEVSLFAGGLGGGGGTGSIGYEKDGHHFEFGLPAALSTDSEGKSGLRFFVAHD